MRTTLQALWTIAVLACSVSLHAQKPCKHTVVGHLETVQLTSTVFHNTRNLYVWLPPGYGDPANAQKKYPVLYLFDGASAFDACTAFLHDELHADETLTDLITSGKIPPVIAVGIENASDILGHDPKGDNTDKGEARAREYLPYPDALFGIKTVDGDRIPDFLERDVIPSIEAKYRILAGPEHRALWGDSYSAIAALYVAIRRSYLVNAVIIESPSLQVGNGQPLRDTQWLAGAPKRIALGIGTAEISDRPDAASINSAWVRLTRQLAENLKAAAFIPPQVQLTLAEGSHHTTGDFGKRLAAALLFIYRPD